MSEQATHSATARRHSVLTIALHWLSTTAVLLAFAVAWTRAALDDPSARSTLLSIHQGAGLVVLALLLARVGARLAQRREGDKTLSPSMRRAATASHGVLYAALLAMPVLGWALTNARGHRVRLPGLDLPAIVSADPDLADTLESWHVGGAWLLGSVVVLHVAAALFHHLVRRDDVLRAMLPSITRRTPQGHRAPRSHGSRTF